MPKKTPTANFAGAYYPKQNEVIDSKKRFKVVAFGRQAGKSFLAKRSALDRAINRHQRVMIVFPALSAARQHWLEICQMLKDFPVKALRQASKEIEFYGGGYLQIRSADVPQNLRGGTFDYLVLDECAFYTDGETVFWTILMPMITASGGDILLISTPNGKNWFYRAWLKGQKADDKYWQSWRMPAWESPYQDVELLQAIKESMPELRYREEYGAEFLGSMGGVFLGSDEVANVPFARYPASGGVYAAGVDWGSVIDFTVFAVFNIYTRQLVYMEQFTGLSPTKTIKRLVELIHLWQPKITHIEKNGLGEVYLKLLKEVLAGRELTLHDFMAAREDSTDDNNTTEIYNGYRVRDVHMDNPTKRSIIETLAADIQYKRCALLEAENTDSIGALLQSQMSTMQRKLTASGREVTYEAQEGEHDDLVMGVALAYKGVPRLARVDPKSSVKKNLNKSPFRRKSKR